MFTGLTATANFIILNRAMFHEKIFYGLFLEPIEKNMFKLAPGENLWSMHLWVRKYSWSEHARYQNVQFIVYWSLTSLCHSNGHIETMPAREINPFTVLTRIRSVSQDTMIDEQSQRVDTTIRLRPLSHRGWLKIFSVLLWIKLLVLVHKLVLRRN